MHLLLSWIWLLLTAAWAATFWGPTRRAIARAVLAPNHVPLRRARWSLALAATAAFALLAIIASNANDEHAAAPPAVTPAAAPSVAAAEPSPAAIASCPGLPVNECHIGPKPRPGEFDLMSVACKTETQLYDYEVASLDGKDSIMKSGDCFRPSYCHPVRQLTQPAEYFTAIEVEVLDGGGREWIPNEVADGNCASAGPGLDDGAEPRRAIGTGLALVPKAFEEVLFARFCRAADRIHGALDKDAAAKFQGGEAYQDVATKLGISVARAQDIGLFVTEEAQDGRRIITDCP